MMNITSKRDGELLTVYAEGKIDSTTADAAEKAIEGIRAEKGYTSIVLDFEKLQYISSAGLRVVLRLRKAEPTLKVIGVSSDVYDIFEMTGFTEMIPVEKAYRQLSVDGCTIIGKGAKGTVYRYNADTIIKVYNNSDCLPAIKNERELARRAFVLGIPTAISYDIVKVGEKFGSVFELLDAETLTALIAKDPDGIDGYVKEAAALLRQIHGTEVGKNDMPDIKEFVNLWVETIKPYVDGGVYEKIKKLVKDVPDTLNMLHCDYHTNNILVQNGEALLIDMDTLSHGHPVFELANVYITYIGFGEVDPSVVENFLGLPYETAKNIWKKFLPSYLGTDDPTRLTEVENKARLVSYVRLMRHIVRRGVNTENDKKTVELCRERFAELLEKIDSLDF